MAEFCQQCSIELFGKDHRELALPADSPNRGSLLPEHGWLQICEGCGVITTDDEGRCQGDCLNPAHGVTPPDKNCVTAPDGSCVSEKDCMHGPGVQKPEATNGKD